MQLTSSKGQIIDLLMLQCDLVQCMLFSMVNKLVTASRYNVQNVPTSMVLLMRFQCIHVDAHMESVEAEDKKQRSCY
jgi:hypothetical protein